MTQLGDVGDRPSRGILRPPPEVPALESVLRRLAVNMTFMGKPHRIRLPFRP